jgi:hypothetical protein
MSPSTKKGRIKSRWVYKPPKQLQNAIKNKTLEAARQKFEAGDYRVILKCMYLCTHHRVPPPDWLIDAFCDRVGSPENFETWDDAFGSPMPKGTKQAAREEKKNWVPLALKIRKLRAKGIRGQELYEQAADELKLRAGWESVRDAYYRKPKNSRELVEFAASELEAEIREGIRRSDGRLVISLEEYDAWLKNYLKTHSP